MISCTDFGPDKKAGRAVKLYADVQKSTLPETIPSGTVCRIDRRLSAGKIYGFHKIKCHNGQSGYLMLGEEEVFEPIPQASMQRNTCIGTLTVIDQLHRMGAGQKDQPPGFSLFGCPG
jgi:hypothetical protein